MDKLTDFLTKKIYISGPMTGYPDHNSENFYRVETELRNRGFSSIENPIHLQELYGNDETYNFYLKKALQMMLGSDAIYVFGDYKKSYGVKQEINLAHIVGIPLFFEEFND